MESIKPDSSPPDETFTPHDDRPWIVDGLAFPTGTIFRGKYKGYFYCGKVSEGALVLSGRKFLSPCAAALAITRSTVNGWLSWDCKPPGMSSWVNIHTLKNMK